jgi:hypothetical protein
MTEEKIKQGQELLRTIKEVKDFLNVLNQVAGDKSGYACLTLTAKAAVAAPSLTISKFPAITTAFAMAVCNELSKLEKEFEQL